MRNVYIRGLQSFASYGTQAVGCDAAQGLVMQVQDTHPEDHPEAQDALLSGHFGSAIA